MSARDLLKSLNKLRKRDKIQGLPSVNIRLYLSHDSNIT